MRYASFDEFRSRFACPKGAVAILLCEDEFLIAETAAHLKSLGFAAIIACGPGETGLAVDDDPTIAAFPAPIADPAPEINNITAVLGPRWYLTCFNGEFAYFPFCEARGVADFVDFLGSERRDACATYGIDLYSDSLIKDGSVDLDNVHFDTEGWYGFERENGLVDVYGGLGWRFEEYVPITMSRVNRPALFKGGPTTALRSDLWLEDDAQNTVACPWHNNPTMALMSFRRARRMLSHPNFRGAIDTLMWPNSARFEWSSAQLATLGLIEAGQWI